MSGSGGLRHRPGCSGAVLAQVFAASKALRIAARTAPEPVPCVGRSEWLSEDPRVRAEAARACAWCPIRAECAQVAASTPARWLSGVWGGHDYGSGPPEQPPRPRRRRSGSGGDR